MAKHRREADLKSAEALRKRMKAKGKSDNDAHRASKDLLKALNRSRRNETVPGLNKGTDKPKVKGSR